MTARKPGRKPGPQKYAGKIRGRAEALLRAGHGQTRTRELLGKEFNIKAPSSGWIANVAKSLKAAGGGEVGARASTVEPTSAEGVISALDDIAKELANASTAASEVGDHAGVARAARALVAVADSLRRLQPPAEPTEDESPDMMAAADRAKKKMMELLDRSIADVEKAEAAAREAERPRTPLAAWLFDASARCERGEVGHGAILAELEVWQPPPAEVEIGAEGNA